MHDVLHRKRYLYVKNEINLKKYILKMTTSLANLDFGETQITIYGTQNDPLIKCTDLIKSILGYRDAS